MNGHDANERLAAIKARLAAATSGEWWVERTDQGEDSTLYITAYGDVVDIVCRFSDGGLPIPNDKADAAFIAAAPDDVAWLVARVEALTVWVSDLQSGMYVNCVYCGHRYGPGETTPVAMADALKAHIEQCPEHPMSKLRVEYAVLANLVKAANWEAAAAYVAKLEGKHD